MPTTYRFRAKVWLYTGDAAWHFLTLPKGIGSEVKTLFGHDRGWGSLPVRVTIGKTTWKTSIFPDNKTNSYLLPLKAQVRKAEGI